MRIINKNYLLILNPQKSRKEIMAEKRNYSKKNTLPAPVPANEFGKLPPQAPELEEAVLGAIMAVPVSL